MAKNLLVEIVCLCALVGGALVSQALAAPLPHGDTQVSLIEDYKVSIGLQYRVMYDGSNIPLSGVNTAADTDSYDFFRQRMRFNMDVQPTEEVGGFMQLEYRGGWGGSSPASSDPRGVGLSLNAFNRLQARGVRYGYVYYTPQDNACVKSFSAGIIPVSDQLGDTQFSADWDFNVGGIVLIGEPGNMDYRFSYVRFVEGVASSDSSIIDDDAELFIADVNYSATEQIKVGAHVYFLYAPQDLSTALGFGDGKVTQGWYALSGSLDLEPIDLNSFIALNNGDFGGTSNTGFAAKIEAEIPLGSPILKLLAVYASGDDSDEEANDQFRTVQGIAGTEGYWAYTHIYTASGPSDVNDLGVGLDNGGMGLTSAQAKLEVPIIEKLAADIFGGWFYANGNSAAGEKDMGFEVGTMTNYEVTQYLNWQLGFAYAFLGDFYRSEGQDPDDLYEVFSRFQLQF